MNSYREEKLFNVKRVDYGLNFRHDEKKKKNSVP